MSDVFSDASYCPALTTIPIRQQTEHREHELHLNDFCISPNNSPVLPDLWDLADAIFEGDEKLTVHALVTKLLDRKEWTSDSLDAIRAEAQGLLGEKTWLVDTVIEREELKSWANDVGRRVHIGDLLLLCSIKYAEMPAAYQKHKGRICFRGDSAKDEKGAFAIYQELSASPTTIHTANANLAYGLIPGHKTTQADAVRAYVQSKLNSAYDTYVRIPRELWPPEWHKRGFKQPCC